MSPAEVQRAFEAETRTLATELEAERDDQRAQLLFGCAYGAAMSLIVIQRCQSSLPSTDPMEKLGTPAVLAMLEERAAAMAAAWRRRLERMTGETVHDDNDRGSYQAPLN